VRFRAPTSTSRKIIKNENAFGKKLILVDDAKKLAT
jgi:hypothetical protein